MLASMTLKYASIAKRVKSLFYIKYICIKIEKSNFIQRQKAVYLWKNKANLNYMDELDTRQPHVAILFKPSVHDNLKVCIPTLIFLKNS